MTGRLSWVNLAWPMMASASLTLGLIQGALWVRNRAATAQLALAAVAVSIAMLMLMELFLLRAETPGQAAAAVRWMPVPEAVLVLSLICFVHVSFHPGHVQIALAAGGLRIAALALGLLTDANPDYPEIERLGDVRWWGGEITAHPIGGANPWLLVTQISNVLLVAYLLLGFARTLRDRNAMQRRTATVVLGGWSVFAIVMLAFSVLGVPFIGTLGFAFVVLAMSYQLGADILDSTRLSKELRDSQARAARSECDLSLAADTAGLGSWTLDVLHDRMSGNLQARELYGVGSEQEANLAAWLGNVHAEDRGAVDRALADALQSGQYEVDFRVASPNGMTRWIAARGQVEFDAHGRAGSLRGVSFDVTERHDADERFRWLVDAAPSPTVLVDQQGRICLLNAEAETLFGYRCEEVTGRPIEDLVPARLRNGHAALRAEFSLAPMARPMGQRRDLYGLTADGREIPIEIGLNPIRFDDSAYVLVAVNDLTERRRIDREAAQQREQVTHLSRVSMLGELSGSLAHELNQPLSAILSNAQAAQRILLKGPAEPGQLKSILADIVENDRRAGEIIRHLRSMLRKEHVECCPLDMNGVVDDALRLVRSDMLSRDVAVEATLATDIAQVSGDRVQLQQVLLNLLVNAFDAMEKTRGPKLVKISTRPSAKGIVVAVEDRGVGVRASMLDHIFTPFETTKENGLGLGLTVCRTIVEAHGGRIWAEKATPSGARFCFEMPVLGNPP